MTGRHYPNQGRGSEEVRQASEDSLRGIWAALTSVAARSFYVLCAAIWAVMVIAHG